MDSVESAEVSAVSRSQVNRRTSSPPSEGLFAAFFDSARRSASSLADLVLRRGRDAGFAFADRLSFRGIQRPGQARFGKERWRADRPSLSDQLRQRAGEAKREPSRLEQLREQQQEEAAQERLSSDAREASRDDPARSRQERQAEAAAQATATPQPVTAVDGQGQATKGPIEPVGLTAQPGPAGPGNSAVQTTSTVGQNAASHVQGIAPSTGTDQQAHGSAGRQMSSPSSQEAGTQAAGAKAAAGGGRPTGVSPDFQNLLEASARVRGQLSGNPERLASALGGKGLAGRGVDVNQSRSINELAQLVRSTVGARHSTMVLNLEPPELGKLRIDVRMHNDLLTIRLQTETPAGQETLQSRLSDLRSALEQHGIQLQQVEVELRPPTVPPQATHDHDGGQQQHETPWDGSAWRGSDGGSGADTPSGSFGRPADTNESMPPGPGGTWSENEENDSRQAPVRTGVDLVV